MNKRLLALLMVGVMTMSTGTGAFAAKGGNDKGKPGTTKPPIGNMQPRPELTSGGGVYLPPQNEDQVKPPVNNTSGGGVILPLPGDAKELKALQNQLLALNKQLQSEMQKLKKATPKNRKAVQNNIATITKKINATTLKIIAIQKQIDSNKPPVVDTTKPVLINADKIATDNPAIKSGQPLMVKEGIVYMSKNTLESSFGIQINYSEALKKYITKIDGVLVEIYQEKNIIEVDGIEKKVEAKPHFIENRVYFPIKEIDKLLKIEVKWDKTTGIVTVDDLDIAGAPAAIQ